jgi:hypothetical protein
MENKKLLKYLLKDLSELEEMFTESGKNSFDDLEMEFINNRVAGAKKLVQMFLEHENIITVESKTNSSFEHKSESYKTDFSIGKTGIWIEEVSPEIKPPEKTIEIDEKAKAPGIVIHESYPEITSELEMPEKVIEKEPPQIAEEEIHKTEIDAKVQLIDNQVTEAEIVNVTEVKIQEKKAEEVQKRTQKMHPAAVQQELQLEDEEPADIHNKRLGDLFAKEKSVNDLLSDSSKLEHKLSNRPVDNLQSAIGINDRFQYIRELFEGSADNFVKTVADLDSMDDIKEAVDYLQNNFKWKKNETSLKFVNLIKRRFPHE